MLSKRNRKDHVTLPIRILEPVNTNSLSVVREKMESLGITEKDVQEAVAWSRKRK